MYFLLKTGDIPASHMLVYLEGIFFCRCPHHLGYFGHKSVLVGRSAAFSLAKAGCVGISPWTSWCRAFLLRLGVQQLGAEDRVRCQRLDSSKLHTENESQRLNERGNPNTQNSEKVYLFGGFFGKTRGLVCRKKFDVQCFFHGPKWLKMVQTLVDVAICRGLSNEKKPYGCFRVTRG